MPRCFTVLLSFWLVAAAPVPRKDPPRVSFVVDATRPESGSLHVTMTVSGNADDEVKIALPVWAPGAYRIVPYAKAVRDLEAADTGGKRLDVDIADAQTWRVRAGKAEGFVVTYGLQVDRDRLSADHCFIAGPDTYFYLVNHKDAPCRVRFKVPDEWKVGTGLAREGEEYIARDYDTFIDSPTELGKFELVEFEVDKAKYQLVIHSVGPVDGKGLAAMSRRVVKEHNALFGGPPFDRYVFIYHFRNGPGGSGLEHLNSTNIGFHYAAVKLDPMLAASMASHEYFHLWNVKRIRPAELGPFDYTKAVSSKALWFCEGVTSYFGDRALARAGLWNETRYLAHLGGEMESLQNNPDRKVTSMEKASEEVWTRRDWPRVDYYNKGELLGLLMDLRIRTASGGKKSLDDVMRHLYETYCVKPSKEGKGPIGVGYPEDGIVKALEAVTGTDWKDFAAKYIAGVEELPYQEILDPAGLTVKMSAVTESDLGLGLRGVVVMDVPAESAATKAGVKTGDRVTALDGQPVTRSTLRQKISELKVGDEITLTLARGADSLEATLPVRALERVSCRIRRTSEPTELQKKILDGWLGKSTNE